MPLYMMQWNKIRLAFDRTAMRAEQVMPGGGVSLVYHNH